MPTVLIPGGSGLIGTRLSELLAERQYTVLHLSRHPRPGARFATYAWDVEARTIDEEALERADYIINLAGAGIADQRWTDRRKQLIIDSRTESTRLLAEALRRRKQRLRAYLSASAIGYYGDRGEAILHEDDHAGEGFLSRSTVAWENAIREVANREQRTAWLRTGVALSTRGGALKPMLLPLHGFVSTYFGDGQQWYSWIHIDDLCRMYIHALENESIVGPYNAVAPHPVRNKQLAAALPAAKRKPALVVGVPAAALRLGMGEMAHVVLDSSRCSAEKIKNTGFRFEFPELSQALQDVIRREV